MTRRTVLSTFIALFAMTIMLVGSTSPASAQIECCTYTVTVTGLTNSCLPIVLGARWDCLANTVSTTYTSNGVFTQPIPGLTPCPPARCRLLGISLNNSTFVGPNETKRFMIGNCCYLVHYGFNPIGCIDITITRCPESEG